MTKITVKATEIKAWKAEYGEVHEIKVFKNQGEKNEEVFTAFLKNPYHDLNIVSAALAMNDNPMKQNMYLLDNLTLKSDEEFKTDNQVRMAGGIQAKGIIEILGTEVKKH